MASGSVEPAAVPYEPPPPYTQKAQEADSPAPFQTPAYGTSGQPPQPPGTHYHAGPSAGPTTTVVVTEQPIYAVTTVYGFAQIPVATKCPHCQNNIVTQLNYEPGTLTWFIFALLIFLCCWLFAWVPFVDTNTKDIVHTCPQCGAVVGRFRRM